MVGEQTLSTCIHLQTLALLRHAVCSRSYFTADEHTCVRIDGRMTTCTIYEIITSFNSVRTVLETGSFFVMNIMYVNCYDMPGNLFEGLCADGNNGGCQQLCFHVSSNSSRCGCSVGFNLIADGRCTTSTSACIHFISSYDNSLTRPLKIFLNVSQFLPSIVANNH